MKVTVLLLCAVMAGCVYTPEREPQELFQQIPNWDNEALRVCCGHLQTCEPYQSPRC